MSALLSLVCRSAGAHGGCAPGGGKGQAIFVCNHTSHVLNPHAVVPLLLPFCLDLHRCVWWACTWWRWRPSHTCCIFLQCCLHTVIYVFDPAGARGGCSPGGGGGQALLSFGAGDGTRRGPGLADRGLRFPHGPRRLSQHGAVLHVFYAFLMRVAQRCCVLAVATGARGAAAQPAWCGCEIALPCAFCTWCLLYAPFWGQQRVPACWQLCILASLHYWCPR